MLVGNLSVVTKARLAICDAGVSVQVAAIAFAEPGIGLIIVCAERGATVGVVSKSDLVRHLARNGDTEAPLSSVMTRAIATCSPDDDLHQTWRLMAARQLQNLPVLSSDQQPLGTLDIRDALEAILHQEEDQEHMLVDYISGFGYR